MKITREFAPADQYLYDFGLRSYANGWAQVDPAQDASCFGTWAHPTRLLIFTYSSGDTTPKEAGSPQELVAELREIDAWNQSQGNGPARIEPGQDPAMKAACEVLGLGDMFHSSADWPGRPSSSRRRSQKGGADFQTHMTRLRSIAVFPNRSRCPTALRRPLYA
jgi:hypothetical protein